MSDRAKRLAAIRTMAERTLPAESDTIWLLNQIERLDKALNEAEPALANCYDVLEYPATPDCLQAVALKCVREALKR